MSNFMSPRRSLPAVLGTSSNWTKSPFRMLFVALVSIQLGACSKTVQWEEEVPLNTGETIWVSRSAVYVLKGAAGNPFDVGYRPEWNEKLEFNWRGKKYFYEGDASVLLLAIAPHDQRPVLVARASDKNWEVTHKYRCTTPSYVQLLPDVSGRKWSWPPAIEPWLYGLPANLMLERKAPEKMKGRYLARSRADEDAGVSASLTRIDPTFTFMDACKTLSQ